MYFPLSQITTNLYTTGEELFTFSDGQPYEGFYFKTATGKFYTGKTPNDGPNLLLLPASEEREKDAEVGDAGAYDSSANFNILPPEYKSASSVPDNIGQPPTSSVIYPTEEDYEVEEFQRYFLKKNNNYLYKEIDYKTFSQYKNQDPQVQYFTYQPLTLTWNIKGKVIETYRLNKNIVEGVQTNEGWEGFVNWFKFKFAKFYKPGEDETYYTSGGELMIKGTNEEYIGFYHVHTVKGTIMEGRNHRETPHNTLILIEEGDVVLQARIGYDEEVGTSRRTNFPRSTNRGGGY